MSRQLVCGVRLEASQGLDVLRAQGGGWVSLETLGGPGMAVAMHRDGGRRVSWRRRTAVISHQWMAVVSRWAFDWFSRPLGRDQVLDEDLKFQSVRHHLHHFV